jgi:hypothetical protein
MLRAATRSLVALGLISAISITLSLLPLARGRSLPGRPDDSPRVQPARKSSIDNEPLGVEISLPKASYKPLEPIRVTLKLRNNSDQTIHLKIYTNRYADYDFDVADIGKDGKEQPNKTPKTYYYTKSIEHWLGLPSNGDLNIKPHETRVEELNVNMVSDMTALTRYSVKAVVPYWIRQFRVAEEKREASSDAIEVEVKSY